MIKLLFFTDTHYTGKTPISRKDNILQTCIEKTKEVFEIAKKENVDLILHGGDFFDSPEISDSVASEIGYLYLQSHTKIVAIAGNHDIRANNYETLYQTKLGLFDRLGIIKVLRGEESFAITKDGITVSITGQGSDYRSIEDLKIHNVDKNKIHIRLIHAMVVDKGNFPNTIPVEQLFDTEAHITLLGDYHIGWGIIKHNGKLFINPGALLRKTIAEEDIKRHPQVVLIEIDKEYMDAKLIPLQNVKPVEEVFKLEEIEKQRKYHEKLITFKQNLSHGHLLTVSTDIKQLITQYAKLKKLEQAVVDKVYATLNIAQSLLKGDEKFIQ